MEQFGLGGVQRSLAVLRHMVSLIVVLSQRQRGAPKEMVEGRETQRPKLGQNL